MSDMPTSTRVVVCGDFNTRVGNAAPCANDITLSRKCVDVVTCARAKWLISICS